VIKIFCKIDDIDIPLVSVGTSPFIGAGQFGYKALEWRNKFLNNTKAILEILEASYAKGSRGIEVIPIGKILEAAQVMIECHNDYVITGSTYPGPNPKIEALIDIGAKIIFVHGMISDNKGREILTLLDEISSNGIIPGIATHDPISTIKYCIKNSLRVRVFLVPFNSIGFLMGNAKELEDIVDKSKSYYYIGMKTLAAGQIKPKIAFQYISNHNICAVAIGMVTKKQAEETTKLALELLSKKKIENK
jgi:hypothetical protein